MIAKNTKDTIPMMTITCGRANSFSKTFLLNESGTFLFVKFIGNLLGMQKGTLLREAAEYHLENWDGL
jgi:hypothetical protein